MATSNFPPPSPILQPLPRSTVAERRCQLMLYREISSRAIQRTIKLLSPQRSSLCQHRYTVPSFHACSRLTPRKPLPVVVLQGGPSQDCQRASRKLSAHPVVWCASCTPLYCPGALRPRQACSRLITLSGCVLLSQGGPGVRLAWHRRLRQELRRQRCTARRIGGCDNHCDDNDAQHDRASHGQGGRYVLIPPKRLHEIASQACDAQPDPKG